MVFQTHSLPFQSTLKSKASTVECIKVGVSFKVEAVEVWGVDVLAAGMEGISCRKLGEAACTVVHLWASAGEGRGGGAGVEVAQSRGGRHTALTARASLLLPWRRQSDTR